jgi:hypothetical protein
MKYFEKRKGKDSQNRIKELSSVVTINKNNFEE